MDLFVRWKFFDLFPFSLGNAKEQKWSFLPSHNSIASNLFMARGVTKDFYYCASIIKIIMGVECTFETGVWVVIFMTRCLYYCQKLKLSRSVCVRYVLVSVSVYVFVCLCRCPCLPSLCRIVFACLCVCVYMCICVCVFNVPVCACLHVINRQITPISRPYIILGKYHWIFSPTTCFLATTLLRRRKIPFCAVLIFLHRGNAIFAHLVFARNFD